MLWQPLMIIFIAIYEMFWTLTRRRKNKRSIVEDSDEPVIERDTHIQSLKKLI